MKKNKLLNLAISVAPVASGIVISLFLCSLLIVLYQKNPLFIYKKLFYSTFTDWYGIGQVLFKATTLMFTALSFSLAIKCGLINIGAEGQLTTGAFLCAITGIYFSFLPYILLIPLCIFSAFFGGALWGAIAGGLKKFFNANEIVITIMLNFVAFALSNYLVVNFFGLPETIHTGEISLNARLLRVEKIFTPFYGSPVNLSLLIAILSCIILWWLIKYSVYGFELCCVGENPKVASFSGINTKFYQFISMLIAGGVAGMGGINFVMGYKYYYEDGFSGGVGFIGIACSILGKNNPLLIILSAFFFGILSYGGLIINAEVPKEIIEIMQAIFVITIVSFERIFSKTIYCGSS